MPQPLALDEDDFVQAPWAYPGHPLGSSCVLHRGCTYDLRPVPLRRLGQARVAGDDAFSRSPLSEFLLRSNVASVDQRTLVVAVGSNASPVVMHRKFDDHGVSTTIPFVSGTLDGIAVGHSAHVSRRGYVAATPFVAPGESTRVVASLLDHEQLACLDRTEPNYTRHALPAGSFPLRLHNGEQPEAFAIYISKWGTIASRGEDRIRLQSQEEIFETLLQEHADLSELLEDASPRAAMKQLADDSALRDEFRERLARNGGTATSGLEASGREVVPAYGETRATWVDGEHVDTLRCIGSTNDFRRRGEPCVVVGIDEYADLGEASHASVAPAHAVGVAPALAKVIVRADQEPGTVGVDQLVRYAIGAELQEPVRVTPVRVEKSTFADMMLARPQYAMMRVQTGDLAIVEQGVCLMDALSMCIIGIDNGAEVVIEGTAPDGGKVRNVRAHAFAAPDDTMERRKSLSGGGMQARFPAASTALGVTPDLPWIFLDSLARSRLGQTSSKLGTVRVRASRRFQVWRELRELLLVLVLGMVGIASVVTSPVAIASIVIVFMSAIGWGVRHRIKSRLEAST